MSSFNGAITEIPGISVDNFESNNHRAYFLSHCHRDHTQGLSKTSLKQYLKENGVFIYTSVLSAAIIESTPYYGDVKEHIKTLDLGTPTMIKLKSTENHKELFIEVTAIPAGHCFGSVMLLFRTPNKTVLFTGDFRMAINDVCKLGNLHSSSNEPIVINKMYVDTTFLDAVYENFPKRSVSAEFTVSEIKKWLDADVDNYIALHPSARFGYEHMFNEIFKYLNMKVFIKEDDWDLYSLYPDLVPGVTNKSSQTRIHKCRNRSEHFKHINCFPCDSSSKKFLYVHLSAMKWVNYELEDSTFHRKSENRLDICFPTHCSRSELIHFVSYFSPAKVVGFPNEYKMAENKMVDNDAFKVVFKQSKRKRRNDCHSKKLKT